MRLKYWALVALVAAGCDSGSRDQNMQPNNNNNNQNNNENLEVDMAGPARPDLLMPSTMPSNQPQTCSDAAEPNNDRASAKAVTGALSGLTSCAGDDDWYKVTLAAGDTLAVNVDSASPQLLSAFLTEGSQGAVLAKGTPGASGLTVSAQPGAAGDYFVHVVASNQASYDLGVVITPTTKTCAAGSHVQNGSCVKNGCDDLGLEANESIMGSRPLVPGSYKGLKICDANDRDFYAVAAGAGGGLLTVSLKFTNSAGNLDLYVTDGTVTSDGYLHTLDASTTTDQDGEYVVNLMLADATPVYVLVQGDASAVNSYDMELSIDPLDPTRDCTAGCTMLQQLSASKPTDPSTPEAIAAGYYIGTDADYSYARTDLAMWMQWAFLQTAKKFPGTHPVYVSDISNKDGATPGTGTTGGPRHPTTTHVKGHDVDIAYFQTLPDNDYRIICGDGSDTNNNGVKGNYNDGYFCTTNSNVVDLPRQAYFMSLMMGNPFFRVVGVDQTLPTQLIAATEALVNSGDLPAWALYKMKTGLGFGAAGGWEFHHHHIHLSLYDR